MAQPAEAQPGHNSNDLTEDQRKALFFHHLRKRAVHNAKLKELGDAKKADGKLAQADKVVLGDLDYAIKAIGADDKKTVTDRFVAEGEILGWLGLSSGFQSDMFRDRAPAVERIEKQAELAGYAGLERVSGYAEGSDEDTRWLASYDAAQAKAQADFLIVMEKANAAKAGDELIKGGDDEPFPDPDNDDQQSVEAAE